MIVKLPFDLPVRTAARIGAYLNNTYGHAWTIEASQYTEIVGMKEPGRSILAKRLEWIIEDEVQRPSRSASR
jgi:hypothetical protein